MLSQKFLCSLTHSKHRSLARDSKSYYIHHTTSTSYYLLLAEKKYSEHNKTCYRRFEFWCMFLSISSRYIRYMEGRRGILLENPRLMDSQKEAGGGSSSQAGIAGMFLPRLKELTDHPRERERRKPREEKFDHPPPLPLHVVSSTFPIIKGGGGRVLLPPLSDCIDEVLLINSASPLTFPTSIHAE